MPRRPLYWEKADAYLQAMAQRMLAESTITLYDSVLKTILTYADEAGWPSDPRKVMPTDIIKLNTWLQKYYTGTQNQYLSQTVRFLKWCKNPNLDDMRIKITVSRTRVQWLTSQQVGQIIHATKEPFEKAIITTMAYTGGRASEVGFLRTRDVSEKGLLFHGKGRKDRMIPLDECYWREMAPYMDYRRSLKQGSDYFIVHFYGGRVRNLNGHAIGAVCDRLSKRVGFQFCPHDLRRTFGRDLYFNGCDLVRLAEIMGHSSIEMTKRYLGIGEFDITAGMKFRPDYGRVF